MLDALVAGTRDPEVLAELAKRRLRRKIPQLRDALEGRFRPHHALLVAEMLGRIDAANATIDRLSAEIDHRMQPFRELIELLITICRRSRISLAGRREVHVIPYQGVHAIP